MPVIAITQVTLICDGCDRREEVVGENKKAADAAARRAGWAFDTEEDRAVCIRCRPRTYVNQSSWKQREVEQQFRRPFWQVVEECARQGLTLSATAQRLGYRRRTFAGLLLRHGKRDWFPRRERLCEVRE